MARKTIIILHGWQSKMERWNKFAKLLEKDFQVFLPVLPGFGAKKLNRTWGIKDYVCWLKSYIKENKIKKPILAGHSNGARIAAAYAARNKVDRLILMSCAGIKAKPTFKKNFFYLLAKSGKAIFSIGLLKSFKDQASWLLYTAAGEKDYYQAKGYLKPTMSKLLSQDITVRLAKIKAKTLILWGDEDKITPVEDAYIFKQKVKFSKLVIFSRTGHNLPFIKTEKIIARIKEFCR